MKDNECIFVETSPGIGDLIILTPVLRRLKSMYPECKITVASWNPYSLQAIERIPYIDDVHPIRSTLLGRLKSLQSFFHQDCVIFNSYQGSLVRLAKLAGVEKRAGNCKDKYMNTSLFTHPFPYTNWSAISLHSTDYLAKKIGIGLGENLIIDDYQCDVSQPTQEEENKASMILSSVGCEKDKKYIVLSPFGNCSIDLTMNTIKTLIMYWTDRNYNVVLIGKTVKPFEQWYQSNLGIFKGHTYNICGMTSIMEMIAVIKNAKAVVALDSGPMHIACALKRDTAGIFTSNSLTEWKPKNYCYPIKLPLECSSPCNNPHCTKKICGDFDTEFLNDKLNKFEKSIM